jgi:hypothetical protein
VGQGRAFGPPSGAARVDDPGRIVGSHGGRGDTGTGRRYVELGQAPLPLIEVQEGLNLDSISTLIVPRRM